MSAQRLRPHVGRLWAMLLLAAAYLVAVRTLPTLAGTYGRDGMIGVVLGLFICSHPAANAINALFYQRGVLREMTRGWAGLGWVVLNLVVVCAGWLVIVIGAEHFVRGPA